MGDLEALMANVEFTDLRDPWLFCSISHATSAACVTFPTLFGRPDVSTEMPVTRVTPLTGSTMMFRRLVR